MKPILSISLAALATCGTLSAEPEKQKSQAPAAPIKALLITGGCCHDYDNQREIGPAAIDSHSKLRVEWTIFHQRTRAGNMDMLTRGFLWAAGQPVAENIKSGAE